MKNFLSFILTQLRFIFVCEEMQNHFAQFAEDLFYSRKSSPQLLLRIWPAFGQLVLLIANNNQIDYGRNESSDLVNSERVSCLDLLILSYALKNILSRVHVV